MNDPVMPGARSGLISHRYLGKINEQAECPSFFCCRKVGVKEKARKVGRVVVSYRILPA